MAVAITDPRLPPILQPDHGWTSPPQPFPEEPGSRRASDHYRRDNKPLECNDLTAATPCYGYIVRGRCRAMRHTCLQSPTIRSTVGLIAATVLFTRAQSSAGALRSMASSTSMQPYTASSYPAAPGVPISYLISVSVPTGGSMLQRSFQPLKKQESSR
ncbi:hypothetical protein MGYG_09085 [Nannizzia gypsea CBS 118893]|uniref:Uncharacterized protein n=1 Tax=Arthroderma gypseum (strain ATCC MYA-4604 / CBS 118893) TaxID=535722 RepID=E4UVV9_ARTGP|nr:hypothetical protein MGYG_09085 [Nannizzia gypsea CBS 118893]EFR02436.1 hypothetical protein MGYG_09085 [Nannizzia gypsea CBS 118893]